MCSLAAFAGIGAHFGHGEGVGRVGAPLLAFIEVEEHFGGIAAIVVLVLSAFVYIDGHELAVVAIEAVVHGQLVGMDAFVDLVYFELSEFFGGGAYVGGAIVGVDGLVGAHGHHAGAHCATVPLVAVLVGFGHDHAVAHRSATGCAGVGVLFGLAGHNPEVGIGAGEGAVAWCALAFGGMHQCLGAFGALVGHGGFNGVVGVGQIHSEYIDIQRVFRQAVARVAYAGTYFAIGNGHHFIVGASEAHCFCHTHCGSGNKHCE